MVEAYLRLQQWVNRVGQAVQQVVPTERLYVLSVGSQQGNRHVHCHVCDCQRMSRTTSSSWAR